MGKVLFIRQENYEQSEIDAAILRAFESFGGVRNFISRGDRVLLKVNLVSGHDVERRVTTDPSIVRAVAKIVIESGATPFIADSPGIDGFKGAAEKAGFMNVARELGIECRELTDPVNLPANDGADFKRIQVSRYVLESDKVISLAKLKTHAQMYLTMGVKNLFGCVPGRLKAGWHYNVGLSREKFASLLLDIYLGVKPAFTILDGVIGMHKEGPTSGDPYKFGIIGACVDALSMDFALCRMVGGKLEDYPLYMAAKKRNMPQCESFASEIEGDIDSSHVFPGVELPRTKSMRLIPNIPFLERLMTSKPVHIPELCIGCGRCAEICPADALRHESKRLYFDYGKCIRCYCCHEMCPVKAIKVKDSFLLKLVNMIS